MDEFYLMLAHCYAQESKDPSTKVGAVIVNTKGRPIGFGCNGFASGYKQDRKIADREFKYKRVIHAEENALFNCVADTEGATMYLTHPPCVSCCHKIKQKGISEVLYFVPDDDFSSRWCAEETVHELRDLGIAHRAVAKTNSLGLLRAAAKTLKQQIADDEHSKEVGINMII